MTRAMINRTTRGVRKKPGRVPFEMMIPRVAWAVRNLDDIIALEQSPLTKLGFVEKHATDHYQNRLCPRGRALQALIKESLDEVISETAGNGLSRLHDLLDMLRNGLNISKASREIGQVEVILLAAQPEYVPEMVKPGLSKKLQDAIPMVSKYIVKNYF
jgi:hypothetical protein